MSTDPFEQLRLPAEAARPDPRFVARLRRRIAAALSELPAVDVPTIDLPERTAIMTDVATTTPTTASAVVPYICVSPAADAMAWYIDVLGAVETIRYTADDGRIGHAELTIAGGQIMLSDEYPELGVVSPATLGGTSGTLHLTVPDVDAIHRRAVDAGAQVAGEPRDEAYGARSFSMIDPFGHRWTIQTPIGNPSVAEIQEQVSGYTITTPPAAAPGDE